MRREKRLPRILVLAAATAAALLFPVTGARALSHAIFFPLQSPPAQQGCPAQWKCVTIADGVVWGTRIYPETSRYRSQVVNLLAVDPSRVRLRAVMASPAGQYETVSAMGRRTNALAGINGGFFCNAHDCTGRPGSDDICTAARHPPCPSFLPRSLLQIEGYAFSTNCAVRTSLGIPTAGPPAIKQIAPQQGWPDVSDAIGGGPNLVSFVKDEAVVDLTVEGFGWVDEYAPRTAVALTSDTRLLFVTIDGRRPGATGMTLPLLARFLIDELNVRQAMNFDGGGSTAMYLAGRGIVNHPSGKCERAVYNGLFVYAK